MITAMAIAVAPAAAAHTARTASDPADGATLTTGPTRVSATFNEPLQTAFAAMTVVGPDGNLWSTGAPVVEGAVVSVGLRPTGPAGKYTVNYRLTSADGHVVSGAWSFTLAMAGAGTPGPSASTGAADTGLPVWPFLLGAVLVIAAAAVWAQRRRA